jgi:Cu+-exporting ATPase
MEEARSVTAYMIAFDDQHQELIFPVDSKDLRTGDLLLLKAGEEIPADCKLLWGQVTIAENTSGKRSDPPIFKAPQILKKGSLVESGTAKAYVIVSETDIP